MSKYKVGQTVTIVANKHGHGYKLGEKITIRQIANGESYIGRGGWYFCDDEIRSLELSINIKIL